MWWSCRQRRSGSRPRRSRARSIYGAARPTGEAPDTARLQTRLVRSGSRDVRRVRRGRFSDPRGMIAAPRTESVQGRSDLAHSLASRARGCGGGPAPARRARGPRRICSWDQESPHRLDDAQQGRVGPQRQAQNSARETRRQRSQAPPQETLRPRATKPSDPAPGWRALLQIVDGLVDRGPIDSALLIGIREEQAMIADDADEPWDPPRVFADAVHRGIGEQPHVTCPRDAQSRPDIFAGFLRGQRGNLTAQADPLLELPELGETERVREFRLAHQQDLQELARRGLEVREQADLFQRRRRQVLRFVEDEDGVLARARALDEEVVQGHESLRRRLSALGDLQVLEDVLENAVEGQGAIEDRRNRGLAVEPLPQGLEQGGLSGAHLAGQHDEALPFLDAVPELGEGLPVARTHIEEARVRGRVERLLRESVKRQIHATALRSPHFAP